MFSQATRQATRSLVSKRAFSSTASNAMHFPHGPYTNLPFKVHNRKIPYVFVHFGFLTLGLSTPFLIVYYQLKKSGTLE